MADLREYIRRNRLGEPVSIPSVCSAHPDVIAASVLLAKEHGVPLLIEATSNQVNQFGGYTGMRAADFIAFVHKICDAEDVERDQIVFGGDHLGPQVWRDQTAGPAMAHAGELMKSFVEAGFTKLHLDCSEGCRGESAQVSNDVSAERSAQLAKICEAHGQDPDALSYVVGTEVPKPGGARADEAEGSPVPTTPPSALATLEAHRNSFEKLALHDAWDRVVGLVVQPGLEFAPDHIHHFDMSTPDLLSGVLAGRPQIAFEAHSTDYQLPAVFPELARRNFAILKVGPALTFAYRQAVYALDHIAAWNRARGANKVLSAIMEALMLEEPKHWIKHYIGNAGELRLMRHFGYADRIRYYWNQPSAQAAVHELISSLASEGYKRPVVEQYFSQNVVSRADHLRATGVNWPRAIILAQIQCALIPYFSCYKKIAT